MHSSNGKNFWDDLTELDVLRNCKIVHKSSRKYQRSKTQIRRIFYFHLFVLSSSFFVFLYKKKQSIEFLIVTKKFPLGSEG